MPTRRQLLASIGTLSIGTTALATLSSEESRAMAVKIDGLNVADTDRDITNPLQAVQLSVSGQYEYSTSVQPTRLVLRLEARQNDGEWSQLNARALRDLKKSQSGDFTLAGDLLSHPDLDVEEFTPANRGESKSVTIDVRLTMSVSNSGRVLGRRSAVDGATITVNKTTARINMSLGGRGSVSLTTVDS